MSSAKPGQTIANTGQVIEIRKPVPTHVPVAQALLELAAASRIHENITEPATAEPESRARETEGLHAAIDCLRAANTALRAANDVLSLENRGLVRQLKRRVVLAYWQVVLTGFTFVALLAWHMESVSRW